MFSELVQLSFEKIMQTRTYTMIVLGTKEKKFAIYADPNVGKTLQLHLTGTEKPRPLTHDLMSSIFQGMGIQVKHVVINDVQDTVYLSRLFLEQKIGDSKHIVEIDARPSDCLSLAIMSNAPLYCTKELLEKVVPVKE